MEEPISQSKIHKTEICLLKYHKSKWSVYMDLIVIILLEGGCPTNWQLVSGRCLGLVQKSDRSPYINAVEARQGCKEYGADLASVPDNETQIAMYNMLVAQGQVRRQYCDTQLAFVKTCL